MDSKEKIREAQRLTIDRLAECEAAIADLYAAYADAFVEMAEFWQSLSRQEKSHGRMLKSMHKLLDKGHVLFNLGRFDHRAIDDFLMRVKVELSNVEKRPITPQHAMGVALSIETSILDGHFYDIVTSDAPELKIIKEHLSKDTKRHIESIQKQVAT